MATGKAQEQQDFAINFSIAMSKLFAAGTDDLLARMPELLANEFAAGRAELWLWDPSSSSAYLTYEAGQQAEHRLQYAKADQGPVGTAAQARRVVLNLPLGDLVGEEAKFAQRTGLTHLSCFPIGNEEQLLGVLAAYSAGAAPESVHEWWQRFASLCSQRSAEWLATREKDRQITQLSLLFEATRLLNSTLDLSELLELILKIARRETKADRGSVFLVDHKNQQLWSIVATGLGDHEEIRVPFGNGVAGRVAQSGEAINVDDAYALEYFDRSFDQKFTYTTRSLLCMPIRHHTGEIVGVIQLLNSVNGRFSADDQEFLTKLTGHMAMALENARLHREALEKQRLEKELALARNIQRSLLPDAPPVVPGYDIAVVNEMCYEVGGDYYDFLSLGPQSLLLVVADVEGKGVSSAMVMSNLQATLRALVMHLHSLEVLTLSLNEMIYNDTKSEKYLSCFLGLVDTRRHGLHYINAGHVPPVLVSAAGEVKQLTEGGTVVGMFPSVDYTRGSVRLNPGDILICCTDGITEACNADDDEYGSERLSACVVRNRHKSAQAIVDTVLAEVNEFSRGGIHVDDKVLMLMKYTGSGQFESARKSS